MLNYSLIDATQFDACFKVSHFFFFFLTRLFEEFFGLSLSVIACRSDLPVVLPQVTPGSVSRLLNEPLL